MILVPTSCLNKGSKTTSGLFSMVTTTEEGEGLKAQICMKKEFTEYL